MPELGEDSRALRIPSKYFLSRRFQSNIDCREPNTLQLRLVNLNDLQGHRGNLKTKLDIWNKESEIRNYYKGHMDKIKGENGGGGGRWVQQ